MKNRTITQLIVSALVIIGFVCMLFISVSCTAVRGSATSYTMLALGSDVSNISVTKDRFVAASINNSPAFIATVKQVRVMWQSYLMLQGLEFIGGKYFDKAGQELSSSETIRLQELQNAKDIRTAELKLEELKLFPPE